MFERLKLSRLPKPSGGDVLTVLTLASVFMVNLTLSHAQANEPPANPEKTDDWIFTVGAGVGYFADYEGSDDYDVTPLPLAEISWRDTVTIGSVSGPPSLTVKFLTVQGPTPKDRLNFTAAISYFGGRDEDDNDALQGLGDLDGGVTGKLGVDYQWQNFGASAALSRDLNGDREGMTVNAGLRYGFNLASPRTRLTLGTSLTWADDNYMENSFGINAVKAAGSALGYSAFTAESGFKDLGLNATLMHFWTRNVAIVGRVGYKHLLGDATDSPIVDDQGDAGQFSALVGASYRW